MNKFEYTVTLKVVVEAFDEVDAQDAVQDVFGLGDNLGILVTDCEIK